MNTTVDAGPTPIAFVALDCPWCDATVLLEAPLPAEFRCAACSITVEIAPDPVREEPALPRAA